MGSNSSSIVISFSIAILLLLILLLLLSYNAKSKNDSVERFEDGENVNKSVVNRWDVLDSVSKATNSVIDTGVNAISNISNSFSEPFKINQKKERFQNMLEGASLTDSYSLLSGTNEIPPTTLNRDKLTATDLLPTDAASKWAQINPSSSGELTDQNFLTAGYHIGINTVGQSMRNANLQLRSEIPNPQVAVSPWLISTIEPDTRQVTFEIGSAPTTPP